MAVPFANRIITFDIKIITSYPKLLCGEKRCVEYKP